MARWYLRSLIHKPAAPVPALAKTGPAAGTSPTLIIVSSQTNFPLYLFLTILLFVLVLTTCGGDSEQMKKIPSGPCGLVEYSWPSCLLISFRIGLAVKGTGVGLEMRYRWHGLLTRVWTALDELTGCNWVHMSPCRNRIYSRDGQLLPWPCDLAPAVKWWLETHGGNIFIKVSYSCNTLTIVTFWCHSWSEPNKTKSYSTEQVITCHKWFHRAPEMKRLYVCFL